VATLGKGRPEVIVIGIDPHDQSHTAVAVGAPTGELRDERTVRARRQVTSSCFGKSKREALRCKRHLTRTIFRTLKQIEQTKIIQPHPTPPPFLT